MQTLIDTLFPNVIKRLPEMWDAFVQTVSMVAIAGPIALVFGLLFGVILTVTKKDGIMPCSPLYQVLDKLINLFRAIPFIILMPALFPLTRVIVGIAIGTKGAIVPLVIGTIPFFSRQIESALSGVDNGLVEASQSMGSSSIGIIFRVYLRESIPGIARAVSITFISLVGLTTMAGAVGGGGLGDMAVRYGSQRNEPDIIYATVFILLILISIIQGVCTLVAKKTTH